MIYNNQINLGGIIYGKRRKKTKYIDDELEYADQSIALAFLAVEEAKVAFLNAVEAQQEYDEKYGDDE